MNEDILQLLNDFATAIGFAMGAAIESRAVGALETAAAIDKAFCAVTDPEVRGVLRNLPLLVADGLRDYAARQG